MVSSCYGQIGIIEASGGFLGYLVCFAECGFWPSRLIGIRPYWDSDSINDLRDSYGQEWTYEQRKKLEFAGHSCYFVGVVLCQLANVLINKTKRESLFTHGVRNMQMNFAIAATVALAALLVYCPGLNWAVQLYPIPGLWWLPAIPYVMYILIFAEIKKFLCRKYPKTWLDKEFTW